MQCAFGRLSTGQACYYGRIKVQKGPANQELTVSVPG